MATISEEINYSVYITEQTLKELNKAIEKAREEANGEIAQITVKSSFSDVSFKIELGQCESLGFKLDIVKPYVKPGIPIKDAG